MNFPIDEGLVVFALNNGYELNDFLGMTEEDLREELRSKGLLHEDTQAIDSKKEK